MIIYQNWVFDFLRIVIMNLKNCLDKNWGFILLSNNHPTQFGSYWIWANI